MIDRVRDRAEAAAEELLGRYACRLAEHSGPKCIGVDCAKCRRETAAELRGAFRSVIARHMGRLLAGDMVTQDEMDEIMSEAAGDDAVKPETEQMVQEDIDAMLGAFGEGAAPSPVPLMAKPWRYNIGDTVTLLPYRDMKAVVRAVYCSVGETKYECAYFNNSGDRRIELFIAEELEEDRPNGGRDQ